MRPCPQLFHLICYNVRTTSLSHTYAITDDSRLFYPSAFRLLPIEVKELDPSASTSTEMLHSPSSLVDQPETSDYETGQEPYVSIDNSMESMAIAVPTKGQRVGANNTKKPSNTSGGNTLMVTIGTIIPRPTKCLIDLDHVSVCSNKLLRQVLPHIPNCLSHETRCIKALSNYVTSLRTLLGENMIHMMTEAKNSAFLLLMTGFTSGLWVISLQCGL